MVPDVPVLPDDRPHMTLMTHTGYDGTMPTHTEIREIREQAVLAALRERITQPWWGSSTELFEVLQPHVPPYAVISPTYLTRLLTTMKAEGLLEGWTKTHWRTPSKRLLVLLPPGWVWDDASGRWLLHGVPTAAG